MPMASPFSLNLNPKSLHFFTPHIPFAPLHTPTLAFPSKHPSTKRTQTLNSPKNPIKSPKCNLYSIEGQFLISEGNPIDTSPQEIVQTSDETSFNVISALLFIAFVGLSILTIGVIYIGVTDFLQKRESDKFEKEEAAKKKKKSGKKGVRVRRGGPRGFGQKLEDDDFDEEE